MALASRVPEQSENTAFIKELQWKENRSQDEFLGNLLSDETLPKDHIALKHSSSSSSGSGGGASMHTSKSLPTKPVSKTAKPVDDPQIYTQLSINLWKRINAGYLVPRWPPAGVMRSMYTYDPKMIEHQLKEFHRKRDFYSEYNEAAARFKLVHGNKKPLSKPKRVVNGGEDANAGVAKDESSMPTLNSAAQSSTTNPDSTTKQTNQNPMISTETNQNPAPTIATDTANPSARSSAPNPAPVQGKAAVEPSS